jgi:hypothetical protein
MSKKAIDRAIAKYQAATSPAAIKAEIQLHKKLSGQRISAADIQQSCALELVREISNAAAVA